MTTKKLFLCIFFLSFLGLSPAFADIVIIIKGGKTHDDGSVTYHKIEMRFDDNENLYFKKCKGNGPNACPVTGVVTVGNTKIHVENEIYPVIISELKNKNKKGSARISGIEFFWKNAKLVGDNHLECKLTIKE
jgi:hypothetical protein